MVGETRFPYGKYAGKSIAQIALTDYPYLAYIHTTIKKPSLQNEVARVRKALNTFTPVRKCLGNCGRLPTRYSFAMDNTRGTWILDDPWWFCESEKCANSTGLDGPRLFLPIKYDTILHFALGGRYRQPRTAMLSFLRELNEMAGFNIRATEQNCNRFIDDLVRQTGA